MASSPPEAKIIQPSQPPGNYPTVATTRASRRRRLLRKTRKSWKTWLGGTLSIKINRDSYDQSLLTFLESVPPTHVFQDLCVFRNHLPLLLPLVVATVGQFPGGCDGWIIVAVVPLDPSRGISMCMELNAAQMIYETTDVVDVHLCRAITGMHKFGKCTYAKIRKIVKFFVTS